MENEKLFAVRSSPFIHSDRKTRSLMLDVLIALIPVFGFAIYTFGLRVITITVISVASAVLCEYAFEKLMKRSVTVSDLSAVLTGVLIAFNMPVSVPLWIPAFGSAFAIIIVKQLFGGLGKNIVNPALAARVFLVLSFAGEMSNYTKPSHSGLFNLGTDAVSSATPLVALKSGTVSTASLFDMVLGVKAGCIGEVSVLLILLGGIYLLARRVITWHIPVTFIATVFILTAIFPKVEGISYLYSVQEIFSGGLFLGAFFMATDYVTSPVTSLGRIIFGIGCGALTVFIRYFSGFNEGVSFAILIMNLLVYYLDRFTKPVKFGGGGNGKKK